jgi:flagellar motor protein MotB
MNRRSITNANEQQRERFSCARVTSSSLTALVSLVALAGCGQNAYTLSSQNQAMSAQQQTLAQRSQELQNRASKLDRDNQELEGLLAQSRQQIQLLKDELVVVRDQLRSTNEQLASLRTEKQGIEQHAKALTASVQRQAGATIRPNNSLVGKLTAIHLPGVEVRQDGDVIRVELPGEKLFHPGSATLAPGATQMIDGVMADLVRNYPNQIVGIEGHTDSDPIATQQFPSNHHLSTARAMTVYDHLVKQFNTPSGQLFVVGHGANHPVVSNATSTGKTRNRRVELVVYPETFTKK